VSLAALVALAPHSVRAQTGPLLYVPNNTTITAVDTSTNAIVPPPFPAGTGGAYGVAVRADGSFIYDTNFNTPTVSVISAATNTVVATIPLLGTTAYDIALTPDGTRAYVTTLGQTNNLAVINTATNTVLTTLSIGGGTAQVVISPDGTRAYVDNITTQSVSVINTATSTLAATIPNVGISPTWLAISPDGTRLYVSSIGAGLHASGNPVSVIDTVTNTVTSTITLPGNPATEGVAVSRDGTRLYVANSNGSGFFLTAVNTANNAVVANINLGLANTQVASVLVSPDGTHVYVTATGGTVSVVDTATNTLVQTISGVGGNLFSAIASNGSALLGSGGTFTAQNAGSLGSFGPGGAVFTGGTLSTPNGDMTLNLPVTVQSAGGTIDTGGHTITLSNTISGPGTLAVHGNLIFAPTVNWTLNVNGANASAINVTGTATLGGATVGVANGSTLLNNHTYTILTTTGGINGTFAQTVGGATGATLSVVGNDVDLICGASCGTAGSGGAQGLLPLVPPRNAFNVAGAINGVVASGANLPAGFQALFNLSPGQLGPSLMQLSGENHADAQHGAFETMNSFLTLLVGPFSPQFGTRASFGAAQAFAPDSPDDGMFPSELADAYARVGRTPAATVPPIAPTERFHAWGAAYGGTSNLSGDPASVGSHDVAIHAGGFAAGVDYRASPDTVLGFALAGGGTSWALSGGLGDGRSDLFQAGVYGSRQMAAMYVSGALAFANHWVSTNRMVALAGIDNYAASYNAEGFGGRVETGYRVASTLPVNLIPYTALQAQSFHTPSYSETTPGSGQFALAFNSRTASSVRTEVGSWAGRNLVLADGNVVGLFGRAAWAHDWQSDPSLAAAFQSLPGASFLVTGATQPSDLALLTAGAELRFRNGLSVMAKFDGEFSPRGQTLTETARLRYTW
jgi:YVTN family beta-propeller protein